MEREHKKSIIPVHVEVELPIFLLVLGKKKTTPILLVVESLCAEENHLIVITEPFSPFIHPEDIRDLTSI